MKTVTTTAKNTIKDEDRGINLTSTYKAWLTKLDALLAEAGANSEQEPDVKERRFARRMCRSLNSNISKKELAYGRRMERELERLRPTIAWLDGRLYDQLKATGRRINGVYGVMAGETEPSAYIEVTEPRVTDGIEWEHSVLETHEPADVLDYFGLEA